MKKRKPIALASLLVVVTGFACWLRYNGGIHSSRVRINNVSKLRLISVTTREDRNTVSRFMPPGEPAVAWR